LDELIKLEEKIDRLIGIINELKQKVQNLEQEQERLRTQGFEAKKKVDGIIEKIDNLLI
jgi:phage shock protein A